MPIVLNGTTGITNDSGYTGDGVSFADSTPANTLVTTSGGNVGIGTSAPNARLAVAGGGIRVSGYSSNSAGDGVNVQLGTTGGVNYLQSLNGTGTNNLSIDANQITFRTGSYSTAATIDSAGNVGIGTSSPATRLEVVGGEPRLRNSSNWNYSNLNLLRSASNTATPRFLAMMLDGDSFSSTTIGGYNAIWGAYDSAPTTGSTSSALNGAMVYGAYAGHRWNTNGTERMRIDSSGNLLVGITTPTTTFNSTGSDRGGYIGKDSTSVAGLVADGRLCLIMNRTTSTGVILETKYNGNVVGTISTNGSSTSYNTSSDYRLKENIAPITGALAKVQALKPVTYTWKSTGEADEGFIAHELQEVCPSAVTGEKDAVDADGNPVYQGIDTSFLVATLTAAIQEQQAIINAQQAALESLTARVVALEGQAT